jgi:sucrose-6-phosphate hydrolase SacC (GH32 family)
MIDNLDYNCYLDAIATHWQPQRDWIKIGYAPDGYYLKDFCLLKVEDYFHLFHIAGTPGVSCCLPGNEIWFGHARTTNFRHWETLGPCFYIDPDGWDSGHVFAPFVLAKDDHYWMFYTGCSIDNTQRIGAAISTDLQHWQRISDRPLIRPEEYGWAFCPTERGAACRDPHICRVGEEYLLYYTAVTNQGRACIALAVSSDLVHWQDRGPAYVYHDLTHCESSNVQQLGEKYLLFFGGHIDYWSYVVSDNPYHWPPQQPQPLGYRLTAMEVVRRCDPRWLVAFFTFDSYRLYLGSIDWSQPAPGIERISQEDELDSFGFLPL